VTPPTGFFFMLRDMTARRNLTPGPPPFSAMNSTPADSRAARMAAIASTETETLRSLSARLIVGKDSPVASAMSACEKLARCLAARI